MKYIKYIRYIILSLSLLSLYLFIEPKFFKEFGSIAFKLLIIVLFIRPIRDIYPNIKIFNYILIFRRQLGIITWVFAIMHWIGYFLDNNYWLDMLFSLDIWNFSKNVSWWLLAILTALPLILTSNNFSLKKLWKYWKKLHRLSYLMLFLVLIHIWIINNGERFIQISVIIITYIIIYFLAFYSKNLNNNLTEK